MYEVFIKSAENCGLYEFYYPFVWNNDIHAVDLVDCLKQIVKDKKIPWYIFFKRYHKHIRPMTELTGAMFIFDTKEDAMMFKLSVDVT